MDDSAARQFFHKPASARQRQYEALRAVFVDGLPQKDAAGRFGYSYDAFRQLVREFRLSLDQPQQPPFSTSAGLDALPVTPCPTTPRLRPRVSPTPGR